MRLWHWQLDALTTRLYPLQTGQSYRVVISPPVGIIADDEELPGLLAEPGLCLHVLLDEVVLELLLLDGLVEHHPRAGQHLLLLHQLLPSRLQHRPVGLQGGINSGLNIFSSVADPNPGSGALLTPGSGIRDRE